MLRAIPTSRMILICGVIASVLIPWAMEPYVPLPVYDAQQQHLPASGNSILQSSPSANEQPFFELAVKIGAELSGAWLQDRDGFLWVGTFGGGLYRYDGNHLKRFSGSSGELSDSNVTALYEDTDGVIWIGTLGGLNTYDKRTGRFSVIDLPEAADAPGQDGIWTLLGSVDGQIWIGTNGQGMLKYDPAHHTAVRYRYSETDPGSIPDDNVYRISLTHDGRLLLATFGGGAARFDPDSERVDLRLGIAEGLQSLQVWSVFEDSQQRLWIGTQEGLVRFSAEGDDAYHFDFDSEDHQSLGGPVVTSVREDRHGAYWVTSFNGDASLSRLDPDTNTFTRFGTENGSSGQLGPRGARDLFEDRSGILWVVSLDGLAKFDRHSVGFSMVSLGSGLLPMYEDREGTMWLGTISGLRRFDIEKGQATAVADKELSRQLVSAFGEDSRQQFWLGVYGGDLVQFDRASEQAVARYRHVPTDSESLPESNCIRRIVEDRTQPGFLWLLTQGGGLAHFDTSTGKVRRFTHNPDDPDSLCNNTASHGAFLQEADGTLWIGTDNGLDRWNPQTGQFTHLWSGEKTSNGLHSAVIQALHRDQRGDLWVGTSDGLYRLIDAEQGTFDRYTVEDGLSDNMILGILEAEDRLWLSTSNGLTAFDPTGASPVQVFRQAEGLTQGDSFLLTSFYKTRNNEFWFGGPDGVTHFQPNRLTKNTYVPPVMLTELSQGGVSMDLLSDPAYVQSIDINWPTNFFEFKAAALSYSMPGLNRYRYRLEGHDKEWFESETGSGRYSGLPGGNYLLRIQGTNSAGVWNTEGVYLSVVVHPAFWNTRWFRTLGLLFVTAVLAGAAQYVEVLRREVSQRRTAEQRLMESEMRYRSIVEDQQEMLLRMDPEGIITFANRAYCDMNGISPADAVGRHYQWRIVPEDREAVEREVQLATAESPQHSSESRVHRPDGSTAWESWIGRALFGEDGQLLGYQAVGRDITQLRDARTRLMEKESQLAHLARVSALGEMVAGISHEIKQPLATIANFSSAASLVLSNSPVSEEDRDKLKSWIERISNQTTRINAIIRHLRRFSRPNSQRCPVQVSTIIDNALLVSENSTRQTLNSIDVECCPDLPETLADQIQIEQVMVNLIRNACDAVQGREPPCKLTITAREEDHFIVVTVDDTGPGIAAEDAVRIFDSFVTTKESGVGIGLAISRSIIEAHGGSIFAVPQTPGGRVVFTLPVTSNPNERQ
jgi:PAS domain S-box-containing protein